CTGYPYYFDYW
nr:immunoglobulin heavy chain junction region [Mus musculus]